MNSAAVLDWKRAAVLVLAVVLLLVVAWCGGCAPSWSGVGELAADVQIDTTPTPGGCLRVVVTQPIPAPSGWTIKAETRIVQLCDPPSPAPSPSPDR